MAEASIARIERFVSEIAKIPFGHDPKCTNRCKRPAVVAIQFVPMIAVDDQLAFETSRQLQAVDERVPRIAIPHVAGPVPRVLVEVARVTL